MAAVLATGSGAVLSHRSAAALWGIYEDTRALIDVTAREGTARTRPGIRIHSGRSLMDDDVDEHAGIPCTAFPRTLLDLAATVDERTLDRAVDRAEELRLFDLRAVEDVLSRNPRRRGAGALASVLAHYVGPTITRSEAEERFLAAVTWAGLPRPAVNAWLPLPDGGGYSPDFWRELRLIVEVDGRAFHARRRAFAHDRRRDRRLALAGYETRRYAASEVTGEPDRVADEVRAFLADRAQVVARTGG